MVSLQKKTTTKMVCITDDSDDGDENNNPGLVSIEFGGLHLALKLLKTESPTNFLRNNF